jgi:hypothetical protein
LLKCGIINKLNEWIENCLAEVGEHIWPIVEVDHGNPAVDVNFVSVVGAGAPILMGNSIVVTAAVALTAHGTQEFLLNGMIKFNNIFYSF